MTRKNTKMFKFDNNVDKKLNAPSKRKIYDELITKARPVLLKAKDICLLGLCNWRYGEWLKDEFPNIQRMTVIESTQLHFMYRDLECLDEYNIIYVEDDRYVEVLEELMKFDCIIMNPPYDGQLHLKIFEEGVKHLSEDGVCVNLSPTPWLAKFNVNRPMAKYRKTFNGKIKDIEIIDHTTANAMFGTGNAIEELGIYTVTNDNSTPVDLMNYGFNSTTEKNLYDKISKTTTEKCLTFSQCISQGKGSQGGKLVKDYEVNVYTWHGGKTCKDAVIRIDNKKRSFVLYFNSQAEHDNFINSLDTIFMNWYYQMFVVPGDYKIRNYMFVMSDYTQPWTDERFYNFFNITPEEQKIIEETMEKYK